MIWIISAGAGNPFKIADLDLKRYNIEIATGGNIMPAMVAYKQFPGMEGTTYYYFGIPKIPFNEWLVANHYTKFKTPANFLTAGGMAAGIAVVEALKKTNGDGSAEKLIPAMEGLAFPVAEGPHDLPQGGPPGDAEHVPLQGEGRPGVRLGSAGARARNQAGGDRRPDPEQALVARDARPDDPLRRPRGRRWRVVCLRPGLADRDRRPDTARARRRTSTSVSGQLRASAGSVWLDGADITPGAASNAPTGASVAPSS